MRRRATLDSFGLGDRDRDPSPAPTVEAYAGYHVGQTVTVHRYAADRRMIRRPTSFIGIIRKLVMGPFWKFALVEDMLGQHHAVDFGDLA